MAERAYMTSQNYDATIGGIVYRVSVGVASSTLSYPVGWYSVTEYGAVGDGVTDDTGAVESACAAAGAAGGGEVYFPAGATYIVDDADITQANITINLAAGATVSSTATGAPCFDVNGATGFVLKGEGTISGPGKGTAASGCHGISLTSVVNARIEGVEITGFYHGIRPSDDGSAESNQFTNLYIHDCAFVGLWPKEGDTVSMCRFVDIGTTSAHHGCYINTSMDRGCRLIGNHYENIKGSGVQINIGASITVNNLTCVGETMDGCGWGYVMDANGASSAIQGLNISAASINDAVVTDGDTGHGIKMISTAGSISNFHIQAVINDSAEHGLDCDASNVTDGHFDIVVAGAVDYGVNVTSSKCTGRFVVSDCTDLGIYMNSASENHFDITASDNGNSGVYLTGTSTDNYLKIYSLDNTGNGLYFGASASRNRASGILQGNSSTQLNDNGADNNTLMLTGGNELGSGSNTVGQTWVLPQRNGAGTTSHYIGGHYYHASGANDFNPSVTLGSAGYPYAAYVYLVAAAGATDTEITVTGTSITDAGVRTTSDTEVVSLSDGSAGAYYETSKKWLGQVSINKTAGTDRLCNTGWSKYWDNGNLDFTVTGFECLWEGDKAGTLEVELLHHKSSGWTYSAGGTATPPTAIATMSTDHSTDVNTANNVHGAWKRTNLSTAVSGSGSEGVMVILTTDAQNQLASGQFTMNYTTG
jgi:hypothetical protein